MYSLLYVDDEPGLLEIGRLFLEQTGEFTVTCALSAKEGLDLLGRNSFDGIVADYQMPGMDGIELLKEVRTSHGQIPFILFTGRGREEVVIAAINNGADFYLQKGGEPKAQFAELAHKLRQAIGRTHAEKALSDSEKRLTDIINFLPDATLAIDTKGTVIAWNRAIEEMTGTVAADILGKGNYEYAVAFYGKRRPMLIDLVFTPDGQFEQDHYIYTRHTPTTLTAETEFEREGQTPAIHLWGKASRLFNEKGELTGAIESIRDITDMKKSEMELRVANEQLAASGEELRSQYNELAASERKLQENEEKYRTLVEHSQDGIFITQDGHLVFHNRGFREILGYAEGELDGISIDRCLAPEDREIVLARHYARLSGNRLPEMYECSFLNRDGTKRRVKMDVGLASYRGKPATIGTIHDVTGERLQEEELRVSEEKYRSLVENLQDVIYRTDREGRLTMVSPSGLELFGYDSPDDLLGKPIAKSFYRVPEKRQEFLDELYRNGSVKNVEIELRHRDGTPVFVSTSSHLYYDRNGTVLGIEGILHDITAQKKAEEESLKRRQQLEEITATVPGAVYQFYALPDGSWRIPYVSTRAGDIFDAPGDIGDFITWFTDHVHPDDRARFMASVETALQARQNWQFEGRFVKPSGEVIWVQGIASPVPHEDNQVYSGVFMDITQRKLAEEALRESEEKYRLIAENSPDMIYFVDTGGHARYVNTLAATALNEKADNIIGKHLTEIFPMEAARRLDLLHQIIESRTPLQKEIVETLPSGKIWIDVRLSPVIDAAGRVLGVLGVSHDISDRKQTEEDLIESEMKYRMLVENSHDIIYTINPDGIFTFVSPVWTTLLGHPVSEVVGKPFQTFVHPLDISPYEAFLAEVVKTGKPRAGTVYRVFHADGSIRLHMSNISPVFDEQGALIFYIGTAQDITDVRQSENAIREANRKLNLLNSITRHDVANQLTVMQGYTQLAAQRKPEPAIADFLRKIDAAVNVIQRQIEFMRTYQDLGVKAPAWHRIDELVSAARIPDVTVTSACGTAEIFCDPMIGRVFFNLFDNAVRHGKTVTHITVQCEQVSEDLVITVEDNGTGIPPGEKQKIFDKGFGKHTGFGLFLVREILAITDITIHETGSPGKGARFEIKVPNKAYRPAVK